MHIKQVASKPKNKGRRQSGSGASADQWKIVVTCEDERHQVDMIKRFRGEGLKVRALVG